MHVQYIKYINFISFTLNAQQISSLEKREIVNYPIDNR